MRYRRTSSWALLSLLLLACSGCSSWNETPLETAEHYLSRGPNGLDCYPSSWAKNQIFEQPPASIFDGRDLAFDMRAVTWKKSLDAVSGTVRLDHAGYIFEFTVIGFGPNHYYRRDGYYCSKAAIPAGLAPPAIGKMTDEGTAMDGKFSPI